MNINIDTTKINTSAENLETIAKNYNDVIEKIFAELKGLETSGAWQGENANSAVFKYIDIVMEEKKDYYDLALNIQKWGEVLNEYAKNNEHTTNQKI